MCRSPTKTWQKSAPFLGMKRDHAIPDTARMIRINSSQEKSPDAFVSVNYRNTWFWINDSDLHSKQVLLQLMNLSPWRIPALRRPRR